LLANEPRAPIAVVIIHCFGWVIIVFKIQRFIYNLKKFIVLTGNRFIITPDVKQNKLLTKCGFAFIILYVSSFISVLIIDSTCFLKSSLWLILSTKYQYAIKVNVIIKKCLYVRKIWLFNMAKNFISLRLTELIKKNFLK
jgi:hypothetical protein